MLLNRPLLARDMTQTRLSRMRKLAANAKSMQPDQKRQVMLANASRFCEERCWPYSFPSDPAVASMNSLSAVRYTNRVFGREERIANSNVCYFELTASCRRGQPISIRS